METYEGWIVCSCGFVGDGWWQAKDGHYSYYCPGCKQTITLEEHDL